MPTAHQADAFFPDYQFRNGQTLPDLRIHYATLGSPNRNAAGEIDNAVLVLHWTAVDGRALLSQAYMESLFSPGCPLDAQRYYLIFPDNVGHGQSSKPSDKLKAAFPRYGYNDMVDLQHRLVTETLGIKRLHAILGMSMGGMNAWQWAEAYPEKVTGIMPVVSQPTRVSGRNLLWRRLVIESIRADPAYDNGNYSGPTHGWIQGYQTARMMIDGVLHLQATVQDGSAADKFLAEAAEIAARGDANDYLYSMESSADYDPQPDLGLIKAKVLALNFDDDEFNPARLHILERLMPQVKHGNYVVQPGTDTSYGHLTMMHPELWADHVATFMREIGDIRGMR